MQCNIAQPMETAPFQGGQTSVKRSPTSPRYQSNMRAYISVSLLLGLSTTQDRVTRSTQTPKVMRVFRETVMHFSNIMNYMMLFVLNIQMSQVMTQSGFVSTHMVNIMATCVLCHTTFLHLFTWTRMKTKKLSLAIKREYVCKKRPRRSNSAPPSYGGKKKFIALSNHLVMEDGKTKIHNTIDEVPTSEETRS